MTAGKKKSPREEKTFRDGIIYASMPSKRRHQVYFEMALCWAWGQ